jgi:opacity protein-like surface antigen
MIKRLALLCCILLLPTMAAAQGSTNYGDFWVGGQVGGVFTLNRSVDVSFDGFQLGRLKNLNTDAAFSAGAIIGYNFCMPYRQVWERYFGVALDFQWNQFNQSFERSPILNGNQFALTFLGRLQYPLMGSERFTRGRIVPFLMFGPSIVWTNSDFSDFRGDNNTSTNIGVVAEVGMEFFVCPSLSIGPSFRYRHVFGPNNDFLGVKIDSQLDQFMVLGRLAYHF